MHCNSTATVTFVQTDVTFLVSCPEVKDSSLRYGIIIRIVDCCCHWCNALSRRIATYQKQDGGL